MRFCQPCGQGHSQDHAHTAAEKAEFRAFHARERFPAEPGPHPMEKQRHIEQLGQGPAQNDRKNQPQNGRGHFHSPPLQPEHQPARAQRRADRHRNEIRLIHAQFTPYADAK